jgi:hypothetical protein
MAKKLVRRGPRKPEADRAVNVVHTRVVDGDAEWLAELGERMKVPTSTLLRWMIADAKKEGWIPSHLRTK